MYTSGAASAGQGGTHTSTFGEEGIWRVGSLVPSREKSGDEASLASHTLRRERKG